jgi:hypothetical protein
MAPRFHTGLFRNWRRPGEKAAQPDPPSDEASLQLDEGETVMRGRYGNGRRYAKAVKLDVGWRMGPDGPWFDSVREDEHWGGFGFKGSHGCAEGLE